MKDVTIIIPAYNEEKHIEQAILSAVNQAEWVMVSDNCSTDKTPEICKRLAKEYKNLFFYEQKENIGSIMNFYFLLDKVKTKYILHIGAHDYIPENYVATLKEKIEENNKYVLAFSPYYKINEENEIIEECLLDKLDSELSSDLASIRIQATIKNPDYIFCIFGLFKTAYFLKNADFRNIAGVDRLILSKIANEGKFIRTDLTRFYLRILKRDESPEAYMQRINGNLLLEDKYNLTYMCEGQLELLKNAILKDKQNDTFIEDVELYFKKQCYRHYDKYKNIALEELQALHYLKNSNEKYILYGAGTETDYIIDVLCDSIVFLADINSDKHNTYKHGIIIKAPEEIQKCSFKIIISHITRYKEIINFLENNLKIESYRIIKLPTQLNL